MKPSNINNNPQQCPRCGARSNVYGSRKQYNGLMRYRQCPECGRTFKTIETLLQEDGSDKNVENNR